LLIPVRHFEGFDEYEIGYDVTQELGIKKWEVPEMETSGGTRIGDFVPYCSKTDEIRIQTMPEVLDELRGKPYYISTKIDGTSCTITCMDNVIQVCGRNLEYKDEAKCSMWALVHRLELDEKLRTYGKNIGIQGEFAGPGIQKNRLRLNKGDLYVFNIIDLDNRRRYDLDSMLAVCERLGLKTVPIEETGEAFAYDTIEELLERARGKYKSGLAKEGIVVRSTTHDYSQSLQGPLSFKVLNNDFLLKEK
jgi:RNA ligase (TIGR02306 family)